MTETLQEFFDSRGVRDRDGPGVPTEQQASQRLRMIGHDRVRFEWQTTSDEVDQRVHASPTLVAAVDHLESQSATGEIATQGFLQVVRVSVPRR